MTKNDYLLLINFSSIDEIINYLLNYTEYNLSLSKYFTRYNPILSFIKSVHDTNETRWKNITRNLEKKLKNDIEKIQTIIDVKNLVLVLNLLPTLQNDQKINLESLFTNLEFGGIISYNVWLEISNNLSFSSLLTKTIISYPKIHDFIVKYKDNLSLNNLNLVTLEIITKIAFNDDTESSTNLILNSLVFEANIYLLRYLFRYSDSLEEKDNYKKLLFSIRPWKKIHNFIGSSLFNYDQYNQKLFSEVLEKILKLCKKYAIEPSKKLKITTETVTNKELGILEDLLLQTRLGHLKRESFGGNNVAKVILVLLLIIIEKRSLSWLFFAKSQGFDNDTIIEKINLA